MIALKAIILLLLATYPTCGILLLERSVWLSGSNMIICSIRITVITDSASPFLQMMLQDFSHAKKFVWHRFLGRTRVVAVCRGLAVLSRDEVTKYFEVRFFSLALTAIGIFVVCLFLLFLFVSRGQYVYAVAVIALMVIVLLAALELLGYAKILKRRGKAVVQKTQTAPFAHLVVLGFLLKCACLFPNFPRMLWPCGFLMFL